MTASYDVDALTRIRHSTAEFSERQGLVIAVLGLLVGYLAFGDVSAVVLLLFVVLFVAVLNYYRKNFGTVVPRRRTTRLRSSLLGMIAVLTVLAGLVAANVIGLANHLTAGLLFATMLVLMTGGRWRRRIHYLVAAAALAVLTVLPLGFLTGSGEHPFAQDDPVWVLVTFGIMLVVVGLIDHRSLVMALPEHAGTDT